MTQSNGGRKAPLFIATIAYDSMKIISQAKVGGKFLLHENPDGC